MPHDNEQDSLPKCPSGVDGLDQIMGGGLPKGRPTLISGGPGCGKTTLGLEFIARGAFEHGDNGVFVSFEEQPEDLQLNYRSMPWHLDELIEDGRVVLKRIGIDPGGFEETGSFDLEALFVRLGRALDSVNADRVVLDTVEVLLAAFEGTKIVRSELQRLFGWLKDRGVTAVITAETGENSLTRYGLEEYVSDCVISLDNQVRNQVSTRALRVVKYRGSGHGTDEYPFLISEKGVFVFPITHLGLDYPVSRERISTGVSGLDDMMGGKGFYRGTSILVSGTAGTGKSSLAASFVNGACERGERAIYFSFEEGAEQIVRNMRSIGMDLNQWVESGDLTFESERPYRHGMEGHLLRMQQSVRDFDPDVVVVDPLSNLIEVGEEWQTKNTLTRLIDFLKRRGITALLTDLTPGGGATEKTQSRVSSLMDSWLLLRDIERDGERNNVLYILKSRGMEHSKQVREFRFTEEGIKLVDVYVGPEGIVTGTARYTQEMKENLERELRERELERKKDNLKRIEKEKKARLESVRAEYESNLQELKKEIDEAEMKQEIEFRAREKRQEMRGGRTNGEG